MSDAKKSPSKPPKKPRRWRRRLGIAAGVLFVAVIGLWIAINRIPGLGPALADGARSIVGPGPIAWLEDVAYGIQDRVDRWRYGDAPPKKLWDDEPPAATGGPVSPAVATTATPDGGAPEDTGPPTFKAPYDNVASDGDGRWIKMRDAMHPDDPTATYKAIVHPDPKRSFAAIALVAMDMSKLELHLVAGTQEPESMKVSKDKRPGLVPSDRYADLVAVFNGGFKAMHGHWGFMLDGDTYVVPRDIACTVALYKDGKLKLGTWKSLKDTEGEMQWYRQTPPCLVEDGDYPKALDEEYNRNWGAAVGGETVIRRSAIGVDASGHWLFYGLGEAVTAQSLSRGMKAAGCEDAAQLDVNYSYPRFLTYERPNPAEAPRAKAAIIKDIKFVSSEYVTEAEPRDFFYITRRRPGS